MTRTGPVLLLTVSCLPALALAQSSGGTTTAQPGAQQNLTPEAIESAVYDGDDLPEGQSPLTVKLQVLLDRAGISPGVIDGYKGGMSESALRAFEQREGFEVDGQLDPQVWEALSGPFAGSVLQSYTITEEDVSNLNNPLPEDYSLLAEMDRLGYTSVQERLAERFHMDQDFLAILNPDSDFAQGATIIVAQPGERVSGTVARVEIRKDGSRVAAFLEDGTMIANYPATIGSEQTPSPSGTVAVVAIALDPTYHYDPGENFQQGDNTEPLVLPPGPNGPVGSVWIDLSKPTYGIHGTPDPAKLFQSFSHGCVRLTNWDAEELAHIIQQGATVEFLE